VVVNKTKTTGTALVVLADYFLVELQGFEPWTSCMPCKRSSQLSYSPVIYKRKHYQILRCVTRLMELEDDDEGPSQAG
jgi:hypothetical protein